MPMQQHTIVVDGKPTTRSRQWLSGFGLIAAGFVWLFCFLIGPLIALGILAFASKDDYGEIIWTFSTDNFWRMFGWGLFGWTSDNLWIIGRSIVLASATTFCCLALGFPLAFWIAARPPAWRPLLLALVMVPACVNLVIRTYAWRLILGNEAPPAALAQWAGLIDPGAALYPSSIAVYLGMISAMLPFAVLPLYTSVERVDWSVVEAARDLYARGWRTFRHGILSQTVPGLIAATILTLIPSLGMFVVSDLLGGAKYMLVGNLIQQQFGAGSDWPFGAMLGLGLIVASLVSLVILMRWGAKEGHL
jgi:spermidine/putrescine transport system permease protein